MGKYDSCQDCGYSTKKRKNVDAYWGHSTEWLQYGKENVTVYCGYSKEWLQYIIILLMYTDLTHQRRQNMGQLWIVSMYTVVTVWTLNTEEYFGYSMKMVIELKKWILMNTDLLRGYIKGDSTQVNFGVTLNTGQHKEDTCNTKARDSNMNRERGSAVMQTQFFFPPFFVVFCCKHFVIYFKKY